MKFCSFFFLVWGGGIKKLFFFFLSPPLLFLFFFSFLTKNFFCSFFFQHRTQSPPPPPQTAKLLPYRKNSNLTPSSPQPPLPQSTCQPFGHEIAPKPPPPLLSGGGTGERGKTLFLVFWVFRALGGLDSKKARACKPVPCRRGGLWWNDVPRRERNR